MISAAGHEQIWFNVDPEVIKKNATAEQLQELHDCGVYYDGEFECLVMFP